MPAAATIRCIECGGEARLLTEFPREEPPEPGDVAAYRCVDCAERWDVVIGDEEDSDRQASETGI